MMYYRKMQYPLTPDLHIRVNKMDDLREFTIEEYGILIKYKTSPYIGFDVWAEEEDVDLFYQIEQNYKKEESLQRIVLCIDWVKQDSNED